MASKFIRYTSMIKLVYKIKKNKTIKIFGLDFVEKNKNNCKMIINNKLCALNYKYEINDDNMKLLKVKLLILNNKKIDLSYMFYECKYLKLFYLISTKKDISQPDYKDENIKNKSENNINTDNFDDLNNQSNLTIKTEYNNNELTNKFNQDIKIYYIYNDFNDNKEKEKNNFIINLSHDFLSSSYSLIKSPNYNFIDYSSFYKNSFSLKSWKIKRMNINENESKNRKYKKDKILARDLSYMFYGCSSLLSIRGLSKINTSNVRKMKHMFEDC